MELFQQIFPSWYMYFDFFLVGVGLNIYLRITKKLMPNK